MVNVPRQTTRNFSRALKQVELISGLCLNSEGMRRYLGFHK